MAKASFGRIRTAPRGWMALTSMPSRAKSASSAAMSGAGGGLPSAASASAPAGSAMAAVTSTVVPAPISPRSCGTMVLATMRLVFGVSADAPCPARSPARSTMALRSVRLRARARPGSSTQVSALRSARAMAKPPSVA